MAIPFSSRVSKLPDVLVTEVSGEAVLLNLKTEIYFGLDEVAHRMWTALTTTNSLQAAYDLLLLEYDVDAEQLRCDLNNLIDNLVQHELVQIHDQ